MIIKGNIDGKRVSSKDLEEQLQKAVKDGAREITVSGRRTARHRRQDLAARREGEGHHRRHGRPARGQHGHGRHRDRDQGLIVRRHGLAQLRGDHHCPGRRGERRAQRGGPGQALRPGRRRGAVRHDDQEEPAFSGPRVVVFPERGRFLCRVQGRRHCRRLRRQPPRSREHPGLPSLRGHGRRYDLFPGPDQGIQQS